MRRIHVVGTTGSGKTTMAHRISERLGVPHVELDAIHWGPYWTAASPEEFLQHTGEALQGDEWVADGNYSKVRELIWSRADTIVWLDYPFPLVFGRLANRTLRRIARNEVLWNGNRESLRNSIFSMDSIIVWQLRTHWRRKREYPLLLARPENAHLNVIRLRSPAQAKAWLAGLHSPQPAPR